MVLLWSFELPAFVPKLGASLHDDGCWPALLKSFLDSGLKIADLMFFFQKAKALHLQNDDLTYEVDNLRGANELNIATNKQKTAESFRRKQEIRDLNEKVRELEKALSSMVRNVNIHPMC